MLFKQDHLNAIVDGSISIAFRKWKSARVKKGSLIKTSVGQLEILSVNVVLENNIDSEDVLNAGYPNLQELRSILNKRKDGQIFRIELRYHSPDPRIELRNQSNLSKVEINDIIKKLTKYDQYSKTGPWTFKVLKAISENPKLRAIDLAHILQVEKDWLKPNVRKLKNMGLTLSHGIGYSLSPRGQVIFHSIGTNAT